MNRDFVEMLDALSAESAEFLIVGAHALAAHGRPRATGDLDIWVSGAAENAKRVWRALQRFGAPLDQLHEADLSTPDLVFQIGLPPARIDILTSLTGLTFEEAWPNRVVISVSGRPLPFLSREDLIRNKRALGRHRDLADVEDLLGE
jgi:hypothetical protein